ncbi:MAG TPA: tetratricopeptide repeat protein [Myxococcales bacterium]
MSSDKLSRKEIRNPDPFVRVTSQLWAKLIENQKMVGLGLAAVFVVFVVSAGAVRMTQSSSKEAGAALARAMELSRRPVEGSMEALQDPTAEQKFKTAQEKHEAVAKAMDEVRKAHAGKEAGRTATVFWADAQFQLGKLDDAIAGYQQYLSESRPDDALRLVACEGLGYAYEGKKDLEKAREAFEKMSKEAAGEPAKARAAYHVARILEAQGKKVEAAAAYQKLKDEYKEAAAAREADERLALLAMQGVPMPEKAKDAPKPPEANKK